MAVKSKLFSDEHYYYKNVYITETTSKLFSGTQKCLTFEEANNLGIEQSAIWENYEWNPFEKNVLLFRACSKPLITNTDNNTILKKPKMDPIKKTKLLDFIFVLEKRNTAKSINISENLRMAVIDWLFEIRDKLKTFYLPTMYLCIKIFDKYLSETCVESGKLRLVITACLNIAHKFLYAKYLDIDKIQNFTDVSEIELEIISKLSFAIWIPTVFHFLDVENLSSERRNTIECLIKISLLDYSLATYLPSTIAKACLCFVSDKEVVVDFQVLECIEKLKNGFKYQMNTTNNYTNPGKNYIKYRQDKKLPPTQELFTTCIIKEEKEEKIAESKDVLYSKIFPKKPIYKRIKKIGSGTFSSVYLAKDENMDVVVKRVQYDSEICCYTIREIAILRELSHSNIINVIDITMDYKYIYIVMEKVSQNLREYLNEAQSVPLQTLKYILKGILSGVEYLHSHNVIHRDLKPENVVVSKKSVKIIDFNLAREYVERGFSNETGCTLWCRPPELLLGVKEYGVEIDIWSVGCIFAEIVNKKPLLPGYSETDQIFQIFGMFGTPSENHWYEGTLLPNFRNSFPKWLPKELKQIVPNFGNMDGLDLLSKMLECDPKKRISAKDALNHRFLDLGF